MGDSSRPGLERAKLRVNLGKAGRWTQISRICAGGVPGRSRSLQLASCACRYGAVVLWRGALDEIAQKGKTVNNATRSCLASPVLKLPSLNINGKDARNSKLKDGWHGILQCIVLRSRKERTDGSTDELGTTLAGTGREEGAASRILCGLGGVDFQTGSSEMRRKSGEIGRLLQTSERLVG